MFSAIPYHSDYIESLTEAQLYVNRFPEKRFAILAEWEKYAATEALLSYATAIDLFREHAHKCKSEGLSIRLVEISIYSGFEQNISYLDMRNAPMGLQIPSRGRSLVYFAPYKVLEFV